MTAPHQAETSAPVAEFSRLLAAETVEATARKDHFEATIEECKALAKRFDLESLHFFRVDFTLKRQKDGTIKVQGMLEAALVQRCVVSLDPVPTELVDHFEALFTETGPDAGEGGRHKDSELIDFEQEDTPEIIENGVIDLGELAAQHLSLAMDPFPRRVDAEIPAAYRHPDEGAEEEQPSVFAQALEQWKQDKP